MTFKLTVYENLFCFLTFCSQNLLKKTSAIYFIMDEQRQDDQLELIYNSSVPLQNIALKTSQERWTIETGGERGSGRSMLAARHDDDDDEIKLWLTSNYFEVLSIWIKEKKGMTHYSCHNKYIVKNCKNGNTSL